jgi:tRNA(Ile)-lysidine synthetase-like protein
LIERIGAASGLDRDAGPSLERAALERLPAALRPLALAALFRRAGADPAPGSVRLAPVLTALEHGERIRRELAGWQILERRGRVVVEEPAAATAPFSYTVSIPGEVELRELGLRFRIRRAAPEPWLERGDPRRAALVFSDAVAAAGARVRSRRPGDRLRPLGGPGTRKLKDLLIDRAVPLAARDRLPLLEIGGRIAWVPGVTIDEAFRWHGEPEIWVAEIESVPGAGNALRQAGVEPTVRTTD